MQQPGPAYPAPAAAAPPAPPAPPAQPPALATGTLLAGRYLIQGYIGGGGFGHIYRAQDRVLGHRRAIKEAYYRDAQTRRQFQLEAEFLLNVRHPNLVRGYAVFEQAGLFYLVMDYVDGQTLEDIAIEHIRRTGRPLPEARVLDWVLPVCDALQALHQQPTPIIHRDVKPANIKLTGEGTPILIDLGLAKLYSAGTQTLGAALAFTPGYAPPEQYQASGATDQRTDVYGMGATLYYLLTGYQPTEAPARLGPHALPTPRSLNPALSPAIERVVLTAMALDPAARQQSARALLDDLRAARATLEAGPASDSSGKQQAVRNRMLPCMRCGTANPAAARFCMRCGSPVSSEHIAAQVAQVAAEGLRLMPAQPALSPPALVPAQAEDQAPGSPFGPVATRISRWVQLAPASRLLWRAAGLGEAADPAEARAVIATVVALVSASLSLLAVFAGWMLIFTVPALLLAGWGWRQRTPAMPPAFRTLALAAFCFCVCWPLLWGLVWLVLP
jgi:hypothetical protein